MGTIILACAMLFAVAVLEVVHYKAPASGPLDEDTEIHLPAAGFSESARQQFLESDFRIVTDVRSLPGPVLQTFTEQGGSRLLIANPGEKFEATDYILDATRPRKRLLFAGIADDKCFVHYEQGGRGLAYVIEFFGMMSNKRIGSLWKGYCHTPAANIQDLRRCMDPIGLPRHQGPT